MAFPGTERQAALLAMVEAVAGPIAERAEQVDRDNVFPFENFADLRRVGYLGATVPERFGGFGATPLELAVAQERLGRACGATALAASMHLILHGRLGEGNDWPEDLYEQVARGAAERGELVNTLHSEPDLGSPSRGGLPSTTATRTAEGWRVDGRKSWASLAPALTWMTVLVTLVDDGPPRRGHLLVPANLPGVRVEATWDNLGMRGTASHDVVFEQVAVPHDHLLPPEPPGPAFSHWSIFSGSAVFLGIAAAARDAAAAYARTRRPSGLPGPIAELPAIQQRVAAIELELLPARTLLFDLARRWDERPEERDELGWQLAAAKLIVTNAVLRATDLALRVSGSAGLSHRSPLQRHFRDARTSLGHPPMEDVVLTVVGRAALGLDAEGKVPPGA